MGLAPSGNGENPGKSSLAKVPVPIFSQPRSVRWIADGTRSVPATICSSDFCAVAERRKRGQTPFAGTARRVLRTKGVSPLFLRMNQKRHSQPTKEPDMASTIEEPSVMEPQNETPTGPEPARKRARAPWICCASTGASGPRSSHSGVSASGSCWAGNSSHGKRPGRSSSSRADRESAEANGARMVEFQRVRGRRRAGFLRHLLHCAGDRAGLYRRQPGARPRGGAGPVDQRDRKFRRSHRGRGGPGHRAVHLPERLGRPGDGLEHRFLRVWRHRILHPIAKRVERDLASGRRNREGDCEASCATGSDRS
jgi:hypothetical protein